MEFQNQSPELLTAIVYAGLLKVVKDNAFPVYLDHIEAPLVDLVNRREGITDMVHDDRYDGSFVIVGRSGTRIKVTVEPEVRDVDSVD